MPYSPWIPRGNVGQDGDGPLRATGKGGTRLISKNGKPVGNILAASLLGLAGAAAWILLSVGQAGALEIVDQTATNVNVGVAVANTGGNLAVGNASDNDADVDQAAVAIGGGGGDTVAVNTADASNESNGTASIVTGPATATGNTASNTTSQVADGGGDDGIVIADQTANNINVGIGVANTGLNAGIGNASDNDADVDQFALAIGGGGGDTIAANNAEAENESNGTASIITGPATAHGNIASNTTNQVLDGDADGLFVADQTVNNLNFGIGIANSGLNLGVGNVSDNEAEAEQFALALPGGGGDAVAVNDTSASNSSNGLANIVTGPATATGNTANNINNQVQNAATTRGASAWPLLLFAFLIGLVFIGRPVRQLGFARRN